MPPVEAPSPATRCPGHGAKPQGREHSREVALVGEAAGECDLGEQIHLRVEIDHQ